IPGVRSKTITVPACGASKDSAAADQVQADMPFVVSARDQEGDAGAFDFEFGRHERALGSVPVQFAARDSASTGPLDLQFGKLSVLRRAGAERRSGGRPVSVTALFEIGDDEV